MTDFVDTYECMLSGVGVGHMSHPSELSQFIRKDAADGKHYCTICHVFCHSVITCVRNHVEAKHFPDTFTYTCPICHSTFKTKTSLNNHKAAKHHKM